MKPIYIPPFLRSDQLDEIEAELLALDWETKRTARHEYFMADNDTSYRYGRQDDDIEYRSKPFTREVFNLAVGLSSLEGVEGTCFNGCFLNKYDDQHQHLGWHADDFEGMDPSAPIAVMSFGAEREIWVKPRFAPCQQCDGDGSRLIVIPRMLAGNCSSFYHSRVTCSDCGGKGHTEKTVKGDVPPEDRYPLERGSLFIMPPGFQEVMLHRIPKHDRPCGWRISLTFRKFL